MKLLHAAAAAVLASLLACSGSSGTPGPTGPQGVAGAAGAVGPAGATGATGATGPAGATGATGATGSAGPAGAAGAKGDKGDKGDTGAAGANGAAGTNGTNGLDGTPGAAGTTVHVLDGNNSPIGYPVGLAPYNGIALWDDTNDVLWTIDISSGAPVSDIANIYYFDSGCSQVALQGIANGYGTLARQPLRGAQVIALVARGVSQSVTTIYQNSDTGCLQTTFDTATSFTSASPVATVPAYTPPVHIGFLPTR